MAPPSWLDQINTFFLSFLCVCGCVFAHTFLARVNISSSIYNLIQMGQNTYVLWYSWNTFVVVVDEDTTKKAVAANESQQS